MRELTAAELGIFLGHQTAADPAIYNCAEFTTFHEPLDVDIFECALRNVAARFEVLNTRFFEWRGSPKAAPAPLSLADATRSLGFVRRTTPARLDQHGRQSTVHELHAAFDEDIRATFDIAAGETSRHVLVVENNELHAWLHVAHHIVLDGYAFQLVARAIANEYTALCEGVPSTPTESITLEELQRADAAYQTSQFHADDAAFFARAPLTRWPRARLSTYETYAGHGLATTAARPSRAQVTAQASTLTRLQDCARRLGASWPEVALAITADFVARASGMQRFVLGVPVMLRLGTPKLNVPCMAMNIVRVPFAIDAGQSLSETVRQLQRRWREQSPHHRYRYEELKDSTFGPVVNVLPFSEALKFGGVGSAATGLSAGPVTDLSLMITPRGASLELTVDGHPALFNCESLSQLAGEWADALEALSLEGTPSATGPLASSAPTLPTRHAPEAAPDVITLWLEVTRRHGSAIAVVHGNEQVTYRELRARVDRAADNLRREIAVHFAGCAHQVVALELPRSVDALVLLLAALHIGAGYAFLDPEQPDGRRRDLVRRLQPALLVSTAPSNWHGFDGKLRVVSPSELDGEATPVTPQPPSRPDATDPAYVVFTSGSTGAPKGVVIGRGALASFVNSARRAYPFSHRDRVLQFAPLTFDASVEEVFCTLCSGATLVIRDAAMLDSMGAFLEACNRWGITILDLPTAFWHEWVGSMKGPESRPRALRAVLIGGEAADPRHVEAFRRNAPGVELVNTYGPSETTVVATYAILKSADTCTDVPIGAPLSGMVAHVVNDTGVALEGASEGELWLSGPQLATEYLGQAAETNSKFVALGTPPLRAYRTGDRVRRNATGELYFVGRIDHEVKLSGYRISPTEIESVIHRHEAVAACAVTANKRHGHVVLTAHIQLRHADPRVTAPARAPSPHATTLAEQLRRFLLTQLPMPMVPTRYEFYAALPLNSSGKIDRRALKLEDTTTPGDVTDPLFTRSPGRELLATWRAVLGRTDAGPDDDFFRLGGHSLQVIQMATRLHPIHPDISVSAIFRNPTPRALLAFVTRTHREADSSYRDVAPLDFEPTLQRAPGPSSRSVLVTGATGFVGATLVEALLSRSVTVTCLVRAATAEAARARVLAALSHHQCSLTTEQLARLSVLPFDLSEPQPKATAVQALGAHGAILHCAADVNLTRSFRSLVPANVTATRWLLEYAHHINARFCYVSTLAVAPDNGPWSAVAETIFDAHDRLVDGYQQSKWHAEQLCAKAAHAGLDVQVVRLGRVVGATTHATVNPNDLVWRIARAATRCGHWPDLAFSEVWTAVDTIASILTDLVLSSRSVEPSARADVYHVAHQGTVHLDRLHDRLLSAGYALTRCALGEWLKQVRERGDAEDLATIAFFELAAEGGKVPAPCTFDCSRLLSALPELDTGPLTDALIDRYVAAAVSQRHLPEPTAS